MSTVTHFSCITSLSLSLSFSLKIKNNFPIPNGKYNGGTNPKIPGVGGGGGRGLLVSLVPMLEQRIAKYPKHVHDISKLIPLISLCPLKKYHFSLCSNEKVPLFISSFRLLKSPYCSTVVSSLYFNIFIRVVKTYPFPTKAPFSIS